MDSRSGVGIGRCECAVGIRKLECLQVQVIQRLPIVAARCAQEAAPERAQVLPSGAQVLMVTVSDLPQLAQPELCNDMGDLVRHGEESGRKTDVLPGRVPCDDERIPREVDGRLAREQSRRARRAAVPPGIMLRPLPPGLVPELDVRKQKWTLTRPSARRAIQTHPKVPVHPQYLGRGAVGLFARNLRHLLHEEFIEVVNELEARATCPWRDGH